MKRKRKSKHGQRRRKKVCHQSLQYCNTLILREFYSDVLTLKEYLLKSPVSRRVQTFLEGDSASSAVSNDGVATLLNTAIIGYSSNTSNEDLTADYQAFSQQISPVPGLERSWPDCKSPQAELVDFAIWLLFNKRHAFAQRPPHILCQGLVRASSTWGQNPESEVSCVIPGISCVYPNEHIETLKNEVWDGLLRILGKGGEKIMISLLLDHGIFMPLCEPNLYQLSGPILTQLQPTTSSDDAPLIAPSKKPSEILFNRNRILYSKPCLNVKGAISHGLSRDHVLNQNGDLSNVSHCLNLLRKVFPRQFGLPNVFDSHHDTHHRKSSRCVPKRLRRQAVGLIQRLQKFNARSSYREMLFHYCPLQYSSSNIDETPNSMMHATPVAHVFAFVKNVLKAILPLEAFDNWHCFMTFIGNFINARKYEAFTLNDALCGQKIKNIAWLRPSNTCRSDNLSFTDFNKRSEIFGEWIYFVLDALMIPIIRSHFYVTDSSSHRNRLFYFRHDVWRRLMKPSMSRLRSLMYEPIANADTILHNRKLGYSQIRMLPKEIGMRPISNLKKSCQLRKKGVITYRKSINSIMRPIFAILNYEKGRQSTRLGSTMFSVSDLFDRLQAFRSSLKASGGPRGFPKLYFVKVDVQSCFDSLPHTQLMTMAKKIVTAERYRIHRYTKIELLDSKRQQRSFCEVVYGEETKSFEEMILTCPKQNAVYIDSVIPQFLQKSETDKLLSQHIEENLVRIGKRFYRQKKGIPQGSVLSSILCNFFYGEFENTHLAELIQSPNMLLRLVDDFLFVSANRNDAEGFLRIMSQGNDDYGILIKPEKSLVNFDVTIDSKPVPRVSDDALFPYCGVLISTMDLNLHKDFTVKPSKDIIDSLTIDLLKKPGQSVRRRMLNALKMHMHTMFLDTSYNSVETVFENIYLNMVDVATKFCQYVKALSVIRRPSVKIVASIITDLEVTAYAMVKSKRNLSRSKNFICSISQDAVTRLTRQAFLFVFGRSQTHFHQLLVWLEESC